MSFTPVLAFIESIDVDGSPSSGTASLTLTDTINDGVSVFRPDGGISATLDDAGTAAIVVPSNIGVSPSGTSYVYGLDTVGGTYDPYNVVIPNTGLGTLITGSAPPSSGTGVNGDWYMDTAAHVLYQPKTAGAWPATGTLITDPIGQTPVGVITLARLAPALPSAAMTGYVPESAVGVPNGVASLDGNGNVPLDELGNAAGGGGSGIAIDPVVTGASASITAGHYAPVDTTAQSCALTLPNAPPDKTQCGAKIAVLGVGHTATIHAAGSDVFNKVGGSTSEVLMLLNQGQLYQYTAATKIWTVVADDLALSTLDARYDAAGLAGAVQDNLDTETNDRIAGDDASAQKSANLSDLTNEGTARTNLGLGSASTHSASDFDAAGLASAAESAASAAAATDATNKVASEATLRANADTTLAGSISTETANRITADATTLSSAETFASNALATALAGLAPAEFPAGAQGAGLTHSGIGQTVGGVVVTSGMRVLDTQTGVSAGLWLAASGAWTRPADFATGSNAQGKLVDVDAGSVWLCVSNSVVTVDTTSQVWTQIDASVIQAGSGLSKIGNTLVLALTKALITATGLTFSDVNADQAGAANSALTSAETFATSADTALALTLANRLIPRTPVTATTYTIPANELTPFDTTSNAITAKLPNAPADGTVCGIKLVILGGTNAVTYQTQGSDVFNKTGGGTSGTLSLLSQGALFQYKGGIWYVVSDDLPLPQLDARYDAAGLAAAAQATANAALPKAGGTMSGPIAMGASKITGIANGSAASDAAAFGQIPSGGGLAIYGDGSDGTVMFDGTTTVLGLAPSSSVYTLTRDIYLAAGTINSGVTIVGANFRIFCQGTLTNNGTISCNGGAGSNAGVGGTALANQVLNAATPPAGGAGNTGNGTAGSNRTASAGGAGGAGGTGATTTAGVGGTVGGVPAFGSSIHALPAALSGSESGVANGQAGSFTGGASGGGGGGDATNKGGGGGGAAGCLIVAAKSIAGTGAIQARGGAGGAGSPSSTLGAGGGGGGGGGYVVVISSSVSAGAVAGQTIDAAGGAGGAHHGATATDGTSGNAGTVVLLPN